MAEPQPPARRENILTRKLGPLPTWAWVAIAAGLIVAAAWWKARRAQPSTGSNIDGSQVPPFVNQVYTTVQPPAAEPPEDDDVKHKRRHPRHKPDRDREEDRETDRQEARENMGRKRGGGGTGPPPRLPLGSMGPRGI